LNHATAPLQLIEQALRQSRSPSLMSQQIAAALERGRRDAEAMLESTRGMFGPHPDDYRLVLR
jgi:hypothetical protein